MMFCLSQICRLVGSPLYYVAQLSKSYNPFKRGKLPPEYRYKVAMGPSVPIPHETMETAGNFTNGLYTAAFAFRQEIEETAFEELETLDMLQLLGILA